MSARPHLGGRTCYEFIPRMPCMCLHNNNGSANAQWFNGSTYAMCPCSFLIFVCVIRYINVLVCACYPFVHMEIMNESAHRGRKWYESNKKIKLQGMVHTNIIIFIPFLAKWTNNE